MNCTTTLKSLRQHGACIAGYNKLIRALQGKEFSGADKERETYIRFAHTEPIPLAFILESNGLDDALWSLRACKQAPAMVRAERLYAVWCARQVQHLMTDPRSLAALDVAERHADGEATDEDLSAARDAAWAAAVAVARAAAGDAAGDAAWAAAVAVAGAAAWAAAVAVAEAAGAAGAARDAGVAAGAVWNAAGDARAAAGDAAWAAQKQQFIAVFCETDAARQVESRTAEEVAEVMRND